MMGGNSAAYMMLHNHGDEADAVVSASSDIADAVELHLSQMSADGVMQMIQQEKLDLPAGGELELKPWQLPCNVNWAEKDPESGR